MAKHSYDSNDIFFRYHLANRRSLVYSMDNPRAIAGRTAELDSRFNDMSWEYVWNSQGYRAPEFDTLTPDQFVLVSGCSYTEGVGLPVGYTVAGQFERLSGIPTVNCGISGSGIDTLMYNHMQWIRSGYARPRLVLQQIPSISRRIYVELDDIADPVSNTGAPHATAGRISCWPAMDPLLHTQYADDEQINRSAEIRGVRACFDRGGASAHIHGSDVTPHFTSGRCCDVIQMLWAAQGVPVLFYTNGGDGDMVFQHNHVAYVQTIDYARDLAHDGIETCLAIAQMMYNRWKTIESQGVNHEYTDRSINKWINSYSAGVQESHAEYNRKGNTFIYE